MALHWTDPRACRVREVAVGGQAFREVFYEIGANPLFEFDSILGRTNLIVPARDVLHVKLATPRHPLIGETWLAALATELGQNAAINNSLTTSAANMRPAGVIHTELELTGAQIEDTKKRWNETASKMTSGDVPILTRGLKFQPVTMSAEDQQIIDQKKLNNQTIAAIFGVPAILLGITDTGTQKSAEAVMAEWLAAGLGWLINHIEVALDQFVGLNMDSIGKGREYTELDTRALLRSAFKDRIDGLSKGVIGGIYAPNEARRLEGLPAAKDGDEPRVQQQVIPLSAWDQKPAAPPAPPPALAPPDKPAPAGGQGDEPPPDEGKALELDAEDARAVIASRLIKQMGDRHAIAA
jgi:phage portal protein BeeE